MKKLAILLTICLFALNISAQELLANVQINHSQIGGSNDQVFKTLEKSLRDFINNTSWTGKKLQNFEKIKCNFAIIIAERPTNNSFKGSLVVQAVRPVFNSLYETPLININDAKFGFEYVENENLIFNERQFSGKNLTDVVAFYVYMILGYDADSFKARGGQSYFDTAQKISQNSQSRGYEGWSQTEGNRTRGYLIDNLLREDSNVLRDAFYSYHRNGLDNLANQDQNPAKKTIADALMQLKYYENSFQMNYPFNVFIDTKKDEIFKLFDGGNITSVNIGELKTLMSTFSPKDIDGRWSKWR